MLYRGVGQDNLVKGALDFPDDEMSKRIMSVDSTKRSQINYPNNSCDSNFLKAVKRHQAKARSYSSINDDISEECDITKQKHGHIQASVRIFQRSVTSPSKNTVTFKHQ